MKILLSAATVLAALALSPALAQAQEHEHPMPAAPAPAAHAAPAKPAMGDGCKGGASTKAAPAGHGGMGPSAGHGPPAGHGGMGPPPAMTSEGKDAMEKGCGGMGKGAGHGMSMKGHAMPMGKDKAAPMEHDAMPNAAPKPKTATPKKPVEGS